MSKTILNNQPTSTVTVTKTVPVPNWESEFRPTADKAGDVSLACITTPLDAPTSVVFKSTTIPNVYKGIGATVPVNAQNVVRTGVKLLNQRNEIWTKTDSTDATYKVQIPASCHFVLQIPNDDTVSVSDVESLIDRCYGDLFEVVDSKGQTRLGAMLRQALMPTGL